MDNLKIIEDSYKKMSDDKLKLIVTELDNLIVEAIPILQQELLNRNLKEEVLVVTNFLLNLKENQNIYENLSVGELQEIIDERINSGESIESIKIDLKDNGINLFDILNADSKEREKVYENINYLKDLGYTEEEVNKELQSEFLLEESEAKRLQHELKSKGKMRLFLGYSIVFITFVIIFGFGKFPIAWFFIFFLAVWNIYKGHKEIKK